MYKVDLAEFIHKLPLNTSCMRVSFVQVAAPLEVVAVKSSVEASQR
jgi:hypothetical protein